MSENKTPVTPQQKKVYLYIIVLFTAAFLLILWSFFATHRSNQLLLDEVRGNADLISQGEGGFLRKPTDADGFAEDIALLLGDPALRESMGARNRKEIENYSLEAVLAQVTALYEELLK